MCSWTFHFAVPYLYYCRDGSIRWLLTRALSVIVGSGSASALIQPRACRASELQLQPVKACPGNCGFPGWFSGCSLDCALSFCHASTCACSRHVLQPWTAVQVHRRTATWLLPVSKRECLRSVCLHHFLVQYFEFLASMFKPGFDTVQRNLPLFRVRIGDTLLKHQVTVRLSPDLEPRQR